MQQAELELIVKDLTRRVIEMETELRRSEEKESAESWLRLKTAARLTGSMWTAYLIKAQIDKAIANPASSPLIDGVHYSICGSSYRVNLPKFLAIDWKAPRHRA